MVASAMPPTRSSSTRLARTLPALALLAACGPSAARSTLPAGAPELTRLRFNQLAMQLDLPYFWERDANGDGAPDASELRTLRFHPRTEVDAAGAIAQVRDALRRPPAATERERLVREELDRAAPTLVWNDLSTLPAAHRAFAAHMLTVSDLVDRLYFRQTGAEAMAARVADDSTSRALFRRNWGPGCEGSVTESQPACSAIEGAPRQPVDVYPASLQSDESFCATLEARPDASALLSPFTVVREEGGNLVAVPYPVAYRELVTPLVAELRAAADAIAADPAESALVAYLRAAATAWETNDWVPADEAWSRMSVRNSRWYVRIAPDETYWEPCTRPASTSPSRSSIRARSPGRSASRPCSATWRRRSPRSRATSTARATCRSTCRTSSTSSSTRATTATPSARRSARACPTGAPWPTRAAAAPSR
jgi:hypothetical protein